MALGHSPRTIYSVSDAILVTSVFLAAAVEMVEALTIVLAVGVTREWRSTFVGILAALAALAVIVIVLGPALAFIPIDALRLLIGTLLLIFGLQWLRKAILRASGFKALHDEDAIYQRELAESRAAGHEVRAGLDWYAFTLSFKGVFLEGLEVVFIVLTFGTTAGNIPLACLGAALAVVVVGIAGAVVHQPLSRVPENTMKFAVGVMLTSFGVFWAGEGVGVAWPAQDVSILAIGAFMLCFALVCVAVLQRRASRIAVTA
jgi:uncharacterized membrane protein